MGQIKKTYTKDEKLQAVKLYLEGELSYKAVADRLRIPDTRTVRLWVKRYREEGVSGLEEKRGKSPKPTGTGRPRKRQMSLEEEVIRLRAENEFLKKWLEIEGK